MYCTVYKTQLQVTDVQDVLLPVGSEVLCAREQHGLVCIWYRCDSGASMEPRRFSIIGTGNPAPRDGKYLGTAALYSGNIMLHVFEVPGA